MNENAIVCSCGTSKEERFLENAVTVPAGSVNNGLSVCGYENELSRLPHIHFVEQEYTEGFCPDTTLAVGTLFPELVNIYK